MKQKLISFINEKLECSHDKEILTDDSPLISSGRLESIDIVELMFFIEDNLGVKNESCEMIDHDEIDTINKILLFVEKDRAVSASKQGESVNKL
jgi:acyl carrier protein